MPSPAVQVSRSPQIDRANPRAWRVPFKRPAPVHKSFQVKGLQPRHEQFPVVPPALQVARESFLGAAASFSRPVFTAPVGGCFIRKVTVTSDTTIAAHADDHWTFTLQLVGGTDIAGPLTTDSDTGAALTADTVYDLTRAVAECDLAAGQIVEFIGVVAAGGVSQVASQFNVEVEYIPKAASNDYVAALAIVPPTGMLIVDAKIIANTTVTQDATDYYTFTLQTSAGAAIASRNTLTGSGGTLTADTAAAMTLVTAEKDQAAGVFLELKIDAATEAAVSLGLIEFAVVISYLPRVSNDFLWPLMTAPEGGMFILGAVITSDTTITQDATDYWTFTLQTSGGTAIAVRNTLTGSGGTLTTFDDSAMTRTTADCDQAAGVVLNLKADAATEAAADISSHNITIDLIYLDGVTSQDFTIPVAIVPTGGVKIRKAQVAFDTTITADAAAYWTANLQTAAAVVIGTRNTETGVGGTATADTVYDLTLTASACDQAAGTLLKLYMDAATADSADLSAISGVLNIEYQPNQ